MIELLRNRRSIRKFTDKKVEPDKVELLKEAALRSPSSRNFDPWQFVFVDDPELITKLAESKTHGSNFMLHAPFAVVVLADTTKSDVWVEDCSIASILIQLTAQSLGLGSCWVQIRNRKSPTGRTSDEYVRELLNAPENTAVESVIAIGYPDEHREPKSKDELDFSKIIKNRYA
ncbi:NADH dehydrogenase [Anaerohalosphaera lusitana]|uniref:NADH dehydrogenase n=1 Tax=Anaerohalosphaera lusitana TaxID=1936003 RepID=A0A1U9NM30_9BACT|nr:nitroreductase family protein [Anaerohalosphaera lusitana]AQT68969.1 NADH dehydrogenase [Anaerohalosphaera lusitana]